MGNTGLIFGSILGVSLVTAYFFYKLHTLNWDEAIFEFEEREKKIKEMYSEKNI